MDISFFMHTDTERNYASGAASRGRSLLIGREKTLSSSTQTRADEGGRVRK